MFIWKVKTPLRATTARCHFSVAAMQLKEGDVKMESEKKNETAIFKMIVDGSTFKELMKYVEKVIDEPTFMVYENRLELRNFDRSRVMLIELIIPYTETNELIVKREGHICFDLKKLNKLLRAFKKPTKKLNLDGEIVVESDGENLKVNFQGQNHTLPLLKPNDYLICNDTPKIDFDCEIRIDAKQFYEAIKQSTEYTNICVGLYANRNELRVIAKGENGEYKRIFTEINGIITLDCLTEEVKAAYDPEILSKILNLPIYEIATISFKDDQPIKIEWNTNNQIQLNAWLAPRIDDNNIFEEDQTTIENKETQTIEQSKTETKIEEQKEQKENIETQKVETETNVEQKENQPIEQKTENVEQKEDYQPPKRKPILKLPENEQKSEEIDEFTRLVQIFCRHEHIINNRCVTCGKVFH